MSVDTYLKRKNLSPYHTLMHDDVTIYVSFSLEKWAKAVRVGAKQTLLWRSFAVEAEHKHGISCQH